MASSGNIVGDLLHRYLLKNASPKSLIRWSQGVTLALGLLAVAYARRFGTVIEGVFDAYGFLVAGLFVPTLGAFFWRRSTSTGALWGMLAGGGFTQILPRLQGHLPPGLESFFFGPGLTPVVYGMALSAIVFVAVSLCTPPAAPRAAAADPQPAPAP